MPRKILPTDRFVVERTASDGGGTGHGPHDVYPNGHHVWARQLRADGSYSSKGALGSFYQTGCFTSNIGAVVIVGRMQQTFVPVRTARPNLGKLIPPK